MKEEIREKIKKEKKRGIPIKKGEEKELGKSRVTSFIQIKSETNSNKT